MLQRKCEPITNPVSLHYTLTSIGVLGREPCVAGRYLRRGGRALLRVLLVAEFVVQLQLGLLLAVGRYGHPFVDLHGRVADGHPFLFPVPHLVDGLHDALDVILGPAACLGAHTTWHVVWNLGAGQGDGVWEATAVLLAIQFSLQCEEALGALWLNLRNVSLHWSPSMCQYMLLFSIFAKKKTFFRSELKRGAKIHLPTSVEKFAFHLVCW